MWHVSPSRWTQNIPRLPNHEHPATSTMGPCANNCNFLDSVRCCFLRFLRHGVIVQDGSLVWKSSDFTKSFVSDLRNITWYIYIHIGVIYVWLYHITWRVSGGCDWCAGRNVNFFHVLFFLSEASDAEEPGWIAWQATVIAIYKQQNGPWSAPRWYTMVLRRIEPWHIFEAQS